MRAISLTIVLLLLLSGCKSAEEKQREADLEIHTPLHLDPTEDYELSQWWSNGRQLLRLQEDSRYALFDNLNRYSAPSERGRWSQVSYAVLRLEPYNSRRPQAMRVGVDKIGNEIVLRVRDLPPFRPIDQPPATVEDSLLGGWSGSGGTLSLRADRRYVYTPPDDRARTPARAGGHQGAWTLSGQGLTLQPDSPMMASMSLSLSSAGDRIVLQSSSGNFERVASPTTAAE